MLMCVSVRSEKLGREHTGEELSGELLPTNWLYVATT